MNNHVHSIENLLTKEQYAIAFRISSPCVDKWASKGMIEKIKIGGRVYFKNEPPINKLPEEKAK